MGLHALGLNIHAVHVNGLAAQHTLRPPPHPGLPEDHPSLTVEHISDQAYWDHLAAAQSELQPELSITLPDGWDALTAQGMVCTMQ